MEGIKSLEEKAEECFVESICQNGGEIINISFDDGTEFEIHAEEFKELKVVKLPD